MRPVRAWLLPFLMLLGSWTLLSAQSNLAEGFTKLPEGTVIALMPIDVELFSVTSGGVYEPQAEWTAKANKNLREAVLARALPGKGHFQELTGELDETLAELGHLHTAVAQSIRVHHFGTWKLPSKQGRLDWSLGEEAGAIRKRVEADYALYVFLRDSYASGGRVATMVLFAALGVGIPGGAQIGYASLVDTRTGKIVWFNRMVNLTGDVREPEAARQTLNRLLSNFPG
jgi:hypothetical protein